jgi:hypothetical protein
VQDVIEPDNIEKASSYTLDINYLKEIKAGSETDLFVEHIREGGGASGIDGHLNIFSVEGRQDGKCSFRARLGLG